MNQYQDEFMQELHGSHDPAFSPGMDCPQCRHETMRIIMKRLDDGDSRFDELATSIAANTRITQENSEVLHDVKEIVVMGRSLFKIAGYLGRAAKWIAGIAGSIIGIAGVKEIIDKVSK